MMNPKCICLLALRMEFGKREEALPFDILPGDADV